MTTNSKPDIGTVLKRGNFIKLAAASKGADSGGKGITRQHIGRIVKGQSGITNKTMVKLLYACNAVGISEGVLMESTWGDEYWTLDELNESLTSS